VLNSVIIKSCDEHELVVADVWVQSWVKVDYFLSRSKVYIRHRNLVSVDNLEDLVALRAA
jgi:hypothetical protein